jgi:hypothetical protein
MNQKIVNAVTGNIRDAIKYFLPFNLYDYYRYRV